MQWNCPHCGISLAITDETLGTGWSFSRCYKCGGFALIRRAEINVIKVDKAPPGERIILPESSGDPSTGLLSQDAAQKYAKHTAKRPTPPEKPISQAFAMAGPPGIGPSTMGAALPTPPPFSHSQFNPQLGHSLAQKAHHGFDLSTGSLPDPLPEIPVDALRSKSIPIGIAVATLVAIGSGIYLYIQAQTLWQRARETTLERHDPSTEIKDTSTSTSTSTSSSSALPRVTTPNVNPLHP